MSEHTEPGRVRVTESVMICHFPLHHSSLLTPHLRARHTSHTETQSVLSALINNCHNWREGGREGGREVAWFNLSLSPHSNFINQKIRKNHLNFKWYRQTWTAGDTALNYVWFSSGMRLVGQYWQKYNFPIHIHVLISQTCFFSPVQPVRERRTGEDKHVISLSSPRSSFSHHLAGPEMLQSAYWSERHCTALWPSLLLCNLHIVQVVSSLRLLHDINYKLRAPAFPLISHLPSYTQWMSNFTIVMTDGCFGVKGQRMSVIASRPVRRRRRTTVLPLCVVCTVLCVLTKD